MLGGLILEAGRRPEAVRILSDIFDVNPIVAKIRLDSLLPETAEAQMNL